MIDVVKYGTSESGCDCPAWTYRPDRRPCKHVEALRAAVATVTQWLDHHGDLPHGLRSTAMIRADADEVMRKVRAMANGRTP